MSRPERDPNPQSSDSGSNYLSYQSPTFTLALCLNTGSGSVDILQVKNANCARNSIHFRHTNGCFCEVSTIYVLITY